MDKALWIFGPQLTGIILLFIGVLLKIFPPKFTNRWYRYNIPSVTKNAQTWDEGNRFIPKRMIWSGIILIVFGLLTAWLLSFIYLSANAKALLFFMLMWGGSVGAVIALIVATDKHLAQLFDKS